MRWDRNWLLSGLLLAIALALPGLMLPTRVDPVLELNFSKNRGAISQLHQRRSIEARRSVWVDRLDLAHGNRLAHPDLGPLGFDQHFFMDLSAPVEVRSAGAYRFVVASDDGFALYVGDREICSYPGHRALAAQTCTANLAAGEQTLRLRYFQGGGPSGLRVQYGRGPNAALHWLGEDSRDLRFIRP